MAAPPQGPGQVVDPYPQIKDFIEKELALVNKLQGAVIAGKREAFEQVVTRLGSVDEELKALEVAVSNMVDQPHKFGLTNQAAYRRQVEVENLRYQMSDLKRACDRLAAQPRFQQTPSASAQRKRAQPPGSVAIQMGELPGTSYSQPKRSGLSSALPVSSNARNGYSQLDQEIEDHQYQVRQTLQRQDEDLEEIGAHVASIKRVGYALHDELEEQEQLLLNLEDDADTSHLKLKTLRKKVNEILKRSGNCSEMCIIIGLSIVLVILTVVALA